MQATKRRRNWSQKGHKGNSPLPVTDYHFAQQHHFLSPLLWLIRICPLFMIIAAHERTSAPSLIWPRGLALCNSSSVSSRVKLCLSMLRRHMCESWPCAVSTWLPISPMQILGRHCCFGARRRGARMPFSEEKEIQRKCVCVCVLGLWDYCLNVEVWKLKSHSGLDDFEMG